MAAQRPVFNICVFCGARPGNRPEYVTAAQQLGAVLAQHKIGIVYGGASIGLMGAVADSCLEAGGYVEGVIPDPLFLKEVAHHKLSRRFVVESMHARKSMMAERSNAFIALPGGFGTLEELFEITTWAQLGIHAKPIVLLNVAGFYNTLLTLFDTMLAEGFISAADRKLMLIHEDIETAINDLRTFIPPTSIATWIERDQTKGQDKPYVNYNQRNQR